LWAEGDQTLFIDRQDEYSYGLLFIEMIKKKELLLREFYEPLEKGVKDQTGSTYNHQIIAIVKNNYKHYVIPQVKQLRDISRSFSPGSEWLYIKIYCSVYVSNTLLLQVLYPLIQIWIKEGKIDNWFFVRYNDPEEHIRIRLHLNEIRIWVTLLSEINLEINAYLSQGLVAKIVIDTYVRELERYNVYNYPLIEKYFEYSSGLCMRIIKINQGLNENHSLFLSIKLIDEMYNLFALSRAHKSALASKSSVAFQNELAVDAEAKEVLHNFYHANHIKIRRLIEHPDSHSPMDQYLAELNTFVKLATPVLRQLNSENEELISGLIHMHFNRLFNSHQRTFEMIGYFTIAHYYKSNTTVS
jgi:thiopeptide-type bacteriocin biosynthesis protein